MDAAAILEKWVSPLTEPLRDFRSTTQLLANNHQSSVANFQQYLQELTDTSSGDAFTGQAADTMTALAEDFDLSELAVSGTTWALAGPLLESSEACEAAVESILDAVYSAAGEVSDTGPLLDVTEVVDVTTAAQGGADIPEDVVAAGLTLVEAGTLIFILIQLAGAIFFAWMTWQSTMNSIANTPPTKLPQDPQPVSPVAKDFSQEVQKWANEYPDIPIEYIEWVLRKKGLTDAEIRAWLDNFRRLRKQYPNVPPEFIAALMIKGKFSVDLMEKILQNYTQTAIQMAEMTPEQQALYDKLIQEFPAVDPGFLSHLITARWVNTLTESQIRNFLTKHSNDIAYISMLYAQLQNIPGADRVLLDLANGGPNNYKGSMFQLEWAFAVKPDLAELEVLDETNHKSADARLKNGEIVVDLKAYTWWGKDPSYARKKAKDFAKQIRETYQEQFPDATIEYVFDSKGGPLPKEVVDGLREADPNIIIESFPDGKTY
jgi:hypothetical protein